MSESLKIGILRETKDPPDKRVPLTPSQIRDLKKEYPLVEFFIQPSQNRCYTDEEYKALSITVKEDLADCDIMMGVKEVKKETLIAGKTYLFFAHVAKKQPYNIEMFREIIKKKITLIDYEYLKDNNGKRAVAFGRYAGLVGAYNALRALGIKSKGFNLRPANQCRDLEEMWNELKKIELEPGLKILITGDGRVAHGAVETLNVANVIHVSPGDFLCRNFKFPVFCKIRPEKYTRHKTGMKFHFKHFIENPKEYESAFSPYTKVTDILIACHYWDPDSPVFFSREEMKNDDFRISVIADISCDINGPIPSTIRATTISEPYFCYNPHLNIEEPQFVNPRNIMVMAVDNLPGELPRDSSHSFGSQLKNNILHDLFAGKKSKMINSGMITSHGSLTHNFDYLKDYLYGNS